MKMKPVVLYDNFGKEEFVFNKIENSCGEPIHVEFKGWAPDNGYISQDYTKKYNVGEVFVYHEPFEKDKIDVKTVKLLYIAKNKKLSRHYHLKKSEFFHMIKGQLKIELWDKNGKLETFHLFENQKMFVPAGLQHRMTGVAEENILLEVSTLDSPDDSYRIEKGD